MSNGELREVPKPPGPEAKPEMAPARENEPAPPVSAPEKPAASEKVELKKAEPGAAKPAEVPAPTKDQELMMIERALEKGLLPTYLELPPGTRERFKSQGEATASLLRALLEQKQIRPSQILGLVVKWLKSIPDVNPHFLDQASKIKTDGIYRMYREKQEGALS